VVIDDPHTENEALQAQFNPGIYDKVYEWFTTGPRQRLQPGGAIIVVQTRWSLRDLTGQILETASQREGADQWEVFEFPAILPSGNPLWPEYWSKEMLEAIRAELPTGKWQAQYQQDPTSDENAIIKRADWQMWDREDPPSVSYIIMAMDTAFEAKKSADYSAAVFFGVWDNPEDGDQPNLILLNAWREKLEFPELKARTLELYKEWEPDSVIIEKKASGAPLIAELRRTGIPVQEYTPSRGNDKITRLNAISDIFASGKVWAPNKRWADELIDEVASFPSGRYDDFVDCVSLALSRFRAGGFVGTQHDKNDYEDEWMYKSRRAAYY
jgi:predicted phage terminase large subunit-like protein